MPVKLKAHAEALSSARFDHFRGLIETRCGLHFEETQLTSLSASLRARMQHLGLTGIDEYYERLHRGAGDEEFRRLINLVTVTETCFFRDLSQFRLLRRHIVPTLLADRGSRRVRTVRIWSAGCSTGDEVYSIAVMLSDMGLLSDSSPWTFEIVGTDVNTEALETARRGAYAARALRYVEADLLRRYFRPDGRLFRVNDEIKRRVRFEHANLAHTPMPRPSAFDQDIVFCKNVTIYFQPETRRRLVRQIHDALAEDGFLMLGHSESLWEMDDGFTLVERGGAFCYRKTLSPGRAARIDHWLGSEGAEGEYDRCLAAFQAGEWGRAEALLEALSRSNPAFVPALLTLGALFARLGRYDEAFVQVQRVLALNDLEPRAQLLLGMIALQRDRPAEARQALRRALYLDDSLALGHFWLGNLYRDQGDLDRAAVEYGNVVRGWEQQTLRLTEEFASGLSIEQLADLCRRRRDDPTLASDTL